MTRILWLGAPRRIPNHAGFDFATNFERTGRNTGNLLIGNGMERQLRAERITPYTSTLSAEQINDSFDLIAIPAANFLHANFDFGHLADVLEGSTLPVLLAGLGAQHPDNRSMPTAIPEGTWRFVRAAAERATSIGVRGDYTAELLHNNGIRNVRVVGCPSLYTSLKPATRIRQPDVDGKFRVVVNGSRNVVSHSGNPEAATRAERALMRLAIEHAYPFVYQNETEEMEVVTRSSAFSERRALQTVANFHGVDPGSLEQHLLEHGKVFFDVDEWISWIADFDFSLGTRFHGNLAALLAGVPALILVHDSRTRELCNYAGIPHVAVEDIDEVDARALYERCCFETYEQRYNITFWNYVDFLNENRVEHRLEWEPDLAPTGRIRAPARSGERQ